MENNNANKSGKKKYIIIAIITLVVIPGIIYFNNSLHYETTDNAQLDADIIPVRSSVQGYVKEIRFNDNDTVHKGDTLIIIDDTDLKAKLAQANAALENSRANVLAATNNSSAASSNASAITFNSSSSEDLTHSAQARLTKAQADFKRTESMFQSQAATQAQYDASRAELDVARAQYESALKQYRSSKEQSIGVRSQAEAQKAQVTLAEAIVKQREAELALAQTQLDNAVIKAPCNGVVSRRSVSVGQYITMAQPVCSAVDMEHMWVTANLKETQINRIRKGQSVAIKVDAYPGLKLYGNVTSFVGATGARFSLLPPDNSTGNFVKITQRVPIRIELKELKDEDKNLLVPGLSAFVEIKVN